MYRLKRYINLILICFAILFIQTTGPVLICANYGEDVINPVYSLIDRQQVSPNPEVYPEFYNKGTGQADDGRLMTQQASEKQFAGEKESIAPKENTPDGGNVEKVLVIPVQFTDAHFNASHDQAYFQGITNQMKDYYEKNSGYIEEAKGITIDCTVAPAVTSVHALEYYGKDKTAVGDDEYYIKTYELTREAVRLLDNIDGGFDFAPFDSADDGNIIDHIIIIHAGDGQEDSAASTDIWSHRWAINGGEEVDGVIAYNYACVPETGTLGVFAHEFGHDIGLPDLYDTDGNGHYEKQDDTYVYINTGYTYGVGTWDVMGYGSWNHLPGEAAGTCPANLSAWSKDFLGWNTVTDIDANGTYTLTNIDINNTAYRLWTDGDTDGNEYYLAEYRRKNGYDAGLPGEGLLVWHVDKQQIDDKLDSNMINAYESRLGVELEQADGNWDLWYLNNPGDSGDPFPGNTYNKDFTAVPYRLDFSNIVPVEYSFVEICNINAVGDTATAYFLLNRMNQQIHRFQSHLVTIVLWTFSLHSAGVCLTRQMNISFK